MAPTPTAAPIGRPPAPRRKFTREFLDHLRSTRIPAWALAMLAGYPTPTSFSALFASGEVPATELNIGRFETLAAKTGFSRERVFEEVAR